MNPKSPCETEGHPLPPNFRPQFLGDQQSSNWRDNSWFPDADFDHSVGRLHQAFLYLTNADRQSAWNAQAFFDHQQWLNGWGRGGSTVHGHKLVRRLYAKVYSVGRVADS
jgi:hypothetical protein